MTVTAGAGKDSIVAGENATVVTNDSGTTKVMPIDGATITFDSYDSDTDYANGTGVQTDLGDIASAIANNSILLSDGMASIDGAGAVVFDADADSEEAGATKANFYDKSGDKVKVGFTNTAGGKVDMSDESTGVVMKGNYGEGRPADKAKTGDSTLLGGTGNDTIYAGGNDYINAGAGYNDINLTEAGNRRDSDDGAVVSMTNATGKNVVEGFNNDGFDVHADKVEFDKSKVNDLKATYENGTLTIKTDRASTEIQGAIAGDNPDSSSDISYAEVALVNSDGNEYRVAVAEAGKDILAKEDEEQMALDYLGDKSGVDFSNTNGELAVNLGAEGVDNFVELGEGTYNGENIVFQGINEVKAGSGRTTLVGADGENNTLVAGTGANTIWGGNGGNDLLVGAADNADKDDTTEFFFTEGSGNDTVTNFKFSETNGYNANADKINTNYTEVDEVLTDGSDVIITLSEGADRLRIKDAAGKDFQFENIYATITAQINDTELTYDGTADYFINEGESFTIDGETYTQQSIGLVKGGEVAEGSEGNETFVYPGTWNVITQIGESGEIGLTSDTSVTFTSEDGSQVVAEYDSDGKLTAGTAADELDAIDVTEANKPVEIIGFDSDTTIKSGDTAFTANDDDADFTVDPTVEPAKVDNAGEINLTEGAVTVDGTDTAVIPNGDTDNTITPADSDTEIVVGSDGTISSIDNGDSFTVGDETYTQTPVGLIDSKGNILTSATDGTVTLADLDEAVEMVAVDSDGYIALSDLTGATAIIVDSVEAPTANYGTLSADDEGITVAATDYDAVSGVKTGSAGVYTVNGDTYVAVDIITINVTADATSLYNGTVEIDSSDETTAPASVVIGTKTVTALGTDLQVTAENGAAVSVADINVGEQFSVTENGETVTYTQAEVGLIRNDGKILDGSAIAADGAFTYTFDGTWSGVEVLDDTGAIAIDSDTSDIIYINSDMTAVAATYDSDTGTLTAGDAADEVQAVDVTNAGAEVGIVGFDSDTTIKSGDTQFTSTDDSVTVDPTTEPPTVTADAINLTAGDVSVGSDTEVTAGDYAVKPLGDTAITVDSDGTVSALDSGDSFTCNGSTYTMTPVGLVTDDNKLIESATDGTVTQSELADTVDMVAVDSNGYAPLDNIDASAVVVDSADAPTAIYGTITNSDGAYTVAVADSDTFTGVYTDNAGTFTVNGDEYAASTAVTVNVTASGTALREGVVTVAQAIDVADGGTVSVANDESGLPLWHCYQHY